MSDIENLSKIRHTLAHLTACAVRSLYKGAKNSIGPAIDNGFYQDFDLGDVKISDSDLPKIEEKMKEILKSWTSFERKEVTPEEAKKEFAWNEYKIELIEEFAKEGKTLTFYTIDGFIDLCRGGHCGNPSKDILSGSWKLDRVAGAYWRGDEKNKMLTRNYGLAFEGKEDLEKYLKQKEEAEKRDHKKLGKELDIFTFSELVGSGLPLWTPKGTIMRNLLHDPHLLRQDGGGDVAGGDRGVRGVGRQGFRRPGGALCGGGATPEGAFARASSFSARRAASSSADARASRAASLGKRHALKR